MAYAIWATALRHGVEAAEESQILYSLAQLGWKDGVS